MREDEDKTARMLPCASLLSVHRPLRVVLCASAPLRFQA